MSLHDAYARLTPFELALGGRAAAETLAADVEREAREGGVDDADVRSFYALPVVERFVRAAIGEHADPESVHSLAALAYHGVHFVRAGCPLYLLTAHVARFAVEGAPSGEPVPPSAAGYLQLPQHLFWSAGAEAPASIDGIFWTVAHERELSVLVVHGLRPGAPEMGVVPLPVVPLSDAVEWKEARARGDGNDFATSMPGSEIDGLYGVETAGEVLKLLARVFAYVSSVPGSLEPGPAPPSEGGSPEPSTLTFTRIGLEA